MGADCTLTSRSRVVSFPFAAFRFRKKILLAVAALKQRRLRAFLEAGYTFQPLHGFLKELGWWVDGLSFLSDSLKLVFSDHRLYGLETLGP